MGMRAGLWMLCAALFVAGCAGVEPTTRGGTLRQRSALSGERWAEAASPRDSPPREQPRDTFDALLRGAGIEDRDGRPVGGGSLTPTQASRLLRELLGKPVTLGQFPSRLAVGHLLRKVLERSELSCAELLRRVERFTHLAVLRPDGCLAWVRSGLTQQRVAPVEWRDGGFRAHGFELGRFYEVLRGTRPEALLPELRCKGSCGTGPPTVAGRGGRSHPLARRGGLGCSCDSEAASGPRRAGS